MAKIEMPEDWNDAQGVEAGFVLPLYELDRWYRQRLRETNIPHVFILGRPMVPMSDEYTNDKARWEKDRASLREIAVEYEGKAQSEQERAQEQHTETDRTAVVIYSTG